MYWVSDEIPGTFKVQGLIDFFRTTPRQKPYSTQVRYVSHCDVPNRLWCVIVSRQDNRINCALVYPDVQKTDIPVLSFLFIHPWPAHLFQRSSDSPVTILLDPSISLFLGVHRLDKM